MFFHIFVVQVTQISTIFSQLSWALRKCLRSPEAAAEVADLPDPGAEEEARLESPSRDENPAW